MKLMHHTFLNNMILRCIYAIKLGRDPYGQKRWRNAQKILDLSSRTRHNVFNVSTLLVCLLDFPMSPPPSSFGVDLARLQRVALFFCPRVRPSPGRTGTRRRPLPPQRGSCGARQGRPDSDARFALRPHTLRRRSPRSGTRPRAPEREPIAADNGRSTEARRSGRWPPARKTLVVPGAQTAIDTARLLAITCWAFRDQANKDGVCNEDFFRQAA